MIGWGGEDVPGHPVPINKEGKACMHMQRDNEGIRLPKLLGLAVAGATLLAGMVVLPATQASAADDQYGFSTDDNFRPGVLDDSVQPTLTVTKYFSLVDGYASTGSANDANNFKDDKDLVPAKGIRFRVYEVVPKGENKQMGDIVASDEESWTQKPDTPLYVADTDGQGVINQWYKGDNTGVPTTTKLQFPKGAGHYFVMKEDQAGSPAFTEGPNKLDMTKYTVSTNAFFSLPYATTGSDANSTTGYIYNLHLFPKNRHNTAFAKTVQGVTDSTTGKAKSTRYAKAGDKISYKLSQTIYNEPNKDNRGTPDGKLDTHELKGANGDLRIVDRMSSSLSANNDFTVKVNYKNNTKNNTPGSIDLTKDTDYTLSTPTANPERILKTEDSPNMFPDNPDNVSYYQFDFFGGSATSGIIPQLQKVPATVMQLDITYTATVTGKGDSTGTDGVANDASSDFTENTTSDGKATDPIHEHTNVVNAVLVFGSIKSEKDGYAALPDTQYRLVDATDQDKYLATDGQFYSAGADLPTGVTLFEATANKKGLVVFAGLPIFGSDTTTQNKAATDTVKEGINWRVVETKTPKDWRSPGFPFKQVSYDNHKNETVDDIVQKYGPHATIEPDYSQLSFGNFDAPASKVTQKIQFNNSDIQKYLMHYATDSSDSPLALPLTGGRGILLLLVVGALLMGGALYARSRRNNAARA